MVGAHFVEPPREGERLTIFGGFDRVGEDAVGVLPPAVWHAEHPLDEAEAPIAALGVEPPGIGAAIAIGITLCHCCGEGQEVIGVLRLCRTNVLRPILPIEVDLSERQAEARHTEEPAAQRRILPGRGGILGAAWVSVERIAAEESGQVGEDPFLYGAILVGRGQRREQDEIRERVASDQGGNFLGELR